MASILPDYCLIGDGAVAAWYDGLLANGTISPDEKQAAAVALLQNFCDELSAPPPRDWKSKMRLLLGGGGGAAPSAGLYFHGGVGRGKSFLMDGFFLQLPLERKLRVHFHQFMRHLHADMKRCAGRKDPLREVAGRLARRFDLICFDEFHVSDITDAMLLGRLLKILLDAGARFVMTSNYPPSGLYPNGLARDRFLPAIALLEERLRVVALDGEEDYRRRHLSRRPTYFTAAGDAPPPLMRETFERLACGIAIRQNIKLSGREVPTVARASDCIWFDFENLCAAARAKEDYLQLANRYATVFLSGVPLLHGANISEAARRFTWLIDVLYDQRVKLVLSAAAPLEKLYGGGDGGESGRTLSRLTEMQSAEYLSAETRRTNSDGNIIG